jgi:hypothetical protein
VTGVDAQLGHTGQISGRVTDKQNNPLSGVKINSWRRTLDDDGNNSWLWSLEASTEENGQYQLAGLSVGEHALRFEDSRAPRRFADEYYHNALTLEEAALIRVAPDETVAGIDVQLADASHIAGHVTDENGTPLAGVVVIAIYDRVLPAGSMTTGAEGGYDLALNPGRYALLFSAPEPYESELYDNLDPADLPHAPLIELGVETTVAGIDAQLARATAVAAGGQYGPEAP